MSHKILIYTFFTPHLIAYKVAQLLKDENMDVLYLGRLSTLLNRLKERKYDYILGLGNYRRGTKKLRIEQVFQNKYGKGTILRGGEMSYEPNWNLPLVGSSSYSKVLTNGPCNRSAYLVMQTIKDSKLSSQFAFVHVPRDFSLQQVQEALSSWMQGVID